MKITPTDATVVEQSLECSERFAEIFDRHVSSIHGYLARRTGHERADPLVGEVFRVAFETRHRYQLDRPSALPWLYGIASNVLRQARRTQRLVSLRISAPLSLASSLQRQASRTCTTASSCPPASPLISDTASSGRMS